MRLGIIGLPNSGKTTIFNALTGATLPTGAGSSGQFTVETRTVPVPDERIDRLTALYNPKKTVYATITYADVGGLDKGIDKAGISGQLRTELAQMDGLVHVVRAFESDNVPHPAGSVNPARDLQTLDSEFLLTDLVIADKRVQRLNDELRVKGRKVEGAVQGELDLMQRVREALENETPLRNLDFTPDQIKTMRGFGFLTLKPQLIVVNQGDEVKADDAAITSPHRATAVVPLRGALEAEIAQLDDDDAQMFMTEYGITERSARKVVRLSYELMAVQSFFTVGPDEVRAWRTAVGATAPEAAGAIHTDLQKGFIRAEVMAYDDLITAGSENALKQVGKVRLEGREYVVQDGDILNIRHSG